MRLLERLLEFSNVTLIYHPGRWNIFADVLSRIPTLGQKNMNICSFFYSSNYKELVISKQTPQGLVKSQRKDPDICKIYGRLRNAFDQERFPNVATSNFMLIKGVVFRRNVNEFGKLQLRYFVPRQKILNLLTQAHGMGHFRTNKLYDTLKLNYFWHGMYEDVTAFCDACAICDTLAKPNRQFVLEHVIATEPFEILSMDLVKLEEDNGKLCSELWMFSPDMILGYQ